MTRFTTLLIVTTLAMSATAQTSRVQDDRAAVREIVNDYIQAYFTGDSARMERAVHPAYLKHSIASTGPAMRMREWTGLEMVEDIRSVGAPQLSTAEHSTEITVLDLQGDTAAAKLVTAHWTDYMMLAKWHGQWKIVSVLQRFD
jgi:hypothetical protein